MGSSEKVPKTALVLIDRPAFGWTGGSRNGVFDVRGISDCESITQTHSSQHQA